MTADRTVAVWRTNWLPASETFVLNQLSALRLWHPFLIGCRQVSGGLPVRPDFAPFTDSVASKAYRRMSASVGFPRVFDSVLRSSEAALVHAHFGTGGALVAPVADRLGLPLLVTFHGFDVNTAPQWPGGRGRRYRRRLRRVFASSRKLIAVSGFIAQRLVALGAPPEKIVVHHIGIPIPATLNSETRSGILFVGRLVANKGIDDLLGAYAMLPRNWWPHVPLTVVGYGPLEAELRREAARLDVPVRFLGRRSPAEVAHLMEMSAIFCGPSKAGANGASEGLGMVFLEAASHGLPVVAYRHGGVTEAVQDGETGLLVPEGSRASLAGALEALIRDPKRGAALGAAGFDRVRREFDIESQTRDLEAIYDEVALAGR